MGRVFLRGITSEHYGLKELRRRQLQAPRVRDDAVVVDDARVGHSADSEQSRTWWRIGPGDEPFLTQTLQVHFVELPPRSANRGHGHQNEAAFYILEGAGYEIHDGQRYDWSAGDLVVVHNDSVHRHYNPYDERAVAIVFKAKAAWMYLGLLQQGRGGPLEDEASFGPRVDWSQLWSAGVQRRRKVVKPADTVWEQTPLGRVRVLCSPRHDDVRAFSVDVQELEIPAGGRSGRRWHMADEVLYVLSGSGHSLHWQVEAEIADRYHARIARRPTRHPVKAGDTLYVPTNTVAQHLAGDGAPLRLLSAQNRLFKLLGYDKVVYLEEDSDGQGAPGGERVERSGLRTDVGGG
jgi:quercetin dioxygenase-like cupin family protein